MRICDRCERPAQKIPNPATIFRVQTISVDVSPDEWSNLYKNTDGTDLCDRCLAELQILVKNFMTEKKDRRK